MKTFKEFKSNINFNKHDYPAVIIDHGTGNQDKTKEDKPFNKHDYPSVIIDHGEHAKKDLSEGLISGIKNLFKPKKNIKNSSWFDKDENEHLTTPSKDKNIDDTHYFLNNRKKPLSYDEKDAVSRYTLSSWKINQHFLDQHKNKELYKKIAVPTKYTHGVVEPSFDSEHMDSALNHPIGHELHTYSGVGFDVNKTANSDGILHLPAYTSTSIDKNVAKKFAHKGHRENHLSKRNIIHFHLQENNKGKYLGTDSNIHSEKEFTLPRNTTIKIHNLNNPEEHTSISGEKYHVYHASIIHQE